jgi:hypothetical protein
MPIMVGDETVLEEPAVGARLRSAHPRSRARPRASNLGGWSAHEDGGSGYSYGECNLLFILSL